MKPKLLVSERSSITTAIMILSLLFVVAYTLFLQDAMFMVFAIPLLAFVTFSALRGGDDIDESLENLGWGDRNIWFAIPIGFIGGAAALLVGGILLNVNLANASFLIPNMKASGGLVVASVIPASIAISADIISQWMVVAPSEEAGFRVLAPYALSSIIPSSIFIFTGSTLMWAAYHYPTWLMSGTNVNMYIIIVAWGMIFAALLLITGNILSSITAHAVTNSSIIIINNNIYGTTEVIIGILIIALVGFGIWQYKEKGVII